MHKPLFIGVDGGGTYCRARLVDNQGRILGEAMAGSGNPRIGIEAAWQNILGACLEACRQANIAAEDYPDIRLGLGLAGANQAQEQEIVLAQPSPFGQCYLLSDVYAACLGAFSGEAGALLILGTGSCGVVYQNQEFDVIGGWGFPLSDQGSGARIGMAALEYSLAALDGLLPESPLTQAINAEFANDPAQYVAFQNRLPLPREYGLYTPKVFEFAGQNDPLALRIIKEQVVWVGQYLDCLIAKGANDIVLVGGVSEAIRCYLPERYLSYLCDAQGDAMDGAIRMAQQQIGRSRT